MWFAFSGNEKGRFTFQYVSIISISVCALFAMLTSFTFQYVSIISQKATCEIKTLSKFTFQYVSIISSFLIVDCNFDTPIYIPICFYYFEGSRTTVYTGRLHLHSNMFLLFQVGDSSTSILLLHLHSNMFLLFPLGGKGSDAYKEIFTFQYVSIISLSVSGSFTSVIYLHSNMFLLFRFETRSTGNYSRIYIPICFYYFTEIPDKVANAIKFTFQYVSIISFRCFLMGHLEKQFTFQYVSIISPVKP